MHVVLAAQHQRPVAILVQTDVAAGREDLAGDTTRGAAAHRDVAGCAVEIHVVRQRQQAVGRVGVQHQHRGVEERRAPLDVVRATEVDRHRPVGDAEAGINMLPVLYLGPEYHSTP